MRRPFRRSPFPAGVPSSAARRRVGRTRVPLHRRLLIARSALAYWALVLVLCLVTGTVVSRLVGRAAAAERRFGSTRPALVTIRDLRAGQPVTAAVTRVERRPTSQLPASALRTVPGEASVAGPVARGEVLTAARLEPRSEKGQRGTVSMAVPLGDASVAVRAGDRVDVYATYDPALTPAGAASTSRVAARAEVVRAGRTSVTISVRQSEAPALATAVARSTITVARER